MKGAVGKHSQLIEDHERRWFDEEVVTRFSKGGVKGGREGEQRATSKSHYGIEIWFGFSGIEVVLCKSFHLEELAVKERNFPAAQTR